MVFMKHNDYYYYLVDAFHFFPLSFACVSVLITEIVPLILRE